jgi:hypothetical protein
VQNQQLLLSLASVPSSGSAGVARIQEIHHQRQNASIAPLNQPGNRKVGNA